MPYRFAYVWEVRSWIYINFSTCGTKVRCNVLLLFHLVYHFYQLCTLPRPFSTNLGRCGWRLKVTENGKSQLQLTKTWLNYLLKACHDTFHKKTKNINGHWYEASDIYQKLINKLVYNDHSTLSWTHKRVDFCYSVIFIK